MGFDLTLELGRALTDEELGRLEIERVSLKLALAARDSRDPRIEVPLSEMVLRRVRVGLEVPTPAAILADPTASHWLKNALQTALARDPVDAANDADLLARLLESRAAQMLKGGEFE